MMGPAAAYYAKNFGWNVFPLHTAKNGACDCSRPDCGQPGKHPRTRNGHLDATRDAEQIKAWWDKWPNANIGIATGRASNLAVLDVDPRNGGDDSLEDLRLKHGAIPDTVQSLTGGGGQHYLFMFPELAVGERMRSGKLAPGLDVKADGGYIVAPPSIHASGRAYAWEASSRPGEVPLELAPRWLVEGRAARAAATDMPRGELEACFLYRVFAAAGWLGTRIDAVRVVVRCPWASDHTGAEAGVRDTSTVLFAPSGAHTLGWFHCSHAHCATRTVDEVLAACPADAVAAAKRQERAGRADKPPPGPAPEPPAPEPDHEPASEGDEPPAPPDDPEAWQALLTRTKAGDVKPTYGNICLILRHRFGTRLAYNAMRLQPLLDERPLTDAGVGQVREEIERTWGFSPSDQNAALALRQISEERSFHPVRDYLASLQWDGVLRLERVATEVLGTEATPLVVRMLRAWFVSAVARAMNPGCKVDTVLVLAGPQFYRKSTFFEILGGAWFADTSMDVSNKDGFMQLAASWIYEWAELENVTARKEASEVKAFLTSRKDSFRPPYSRSVVQHERSSVIVGTTNKDQFLNDETGSRRFWIVRVDKLINKELLASWRDQLWAEAREAYAGGYEWWFDTHEEAAREQDAETHFVEDAMQTAIATWLGSDHARQLVAMKGYVLPSEILAAALKLDAGRWDRSTQTRVGVAMRRLGWLRVRVTSHQVGRTWAYRAPGSTGIPHVGEEQATG